MLILLYAYFKFGTLIDEVQKLKLFYLVVLVRYQTIICFFGYIEFDDHRIRSTVDLFGPVRQETAAIFEFRI